MSENKAMVAIYNSHGETENAIKELQRSGFDIKKLSIVGKEYNCARPSENTNGL